MTEKRDSRDKLMNVFSLADIEHLDKTLLNVFLTDAIFNITSEDANAIFDKLPKNSKQEVAVKDVIQHLGARRFKNSNHAKRKAEDKNKVEQKYISQQTKETEDGGNCCDGDSYELKKAPKKEFGDSSQVYSEQIERPSESKSTGGDHRVNNSHSVGLCGGLVGHRANTNDCANHGEIDCIAGLGRVIQILQNISGLENKLTISTLLMVRARVLQYQNEINNLKDEGHKLERKCESLEGRAEVYKATIKMYEEQRERMSEKRMDEYKEITNNYSVELKKQVKIAEKWKRKYAMAQDQVSQLLRFSNQMNKKLERKQKCRVKKGKKLSMLERGVDTKYTNYDQREPVQQLDSLSKPRKLRRRRAYSCVDLRANHVEDLCHSFRNEVSNRSDSRRSFQKRKKSKSIVPLKPKGGKSKKSSKRKSKKEPRDSFRNDWRRVSDPKVDDGFQELSRSSWKAFPEEQSKTQTSMSPLTNLLVSSHSEDEDEKICMV